MSVSVTNRTGSILVSDGNSNTYIKKQLVSVETNGNNVVIRFHKIHYISFPYDQYTAPTGASASAVASAISAFLNT